MYGIVLDSVHKIFRSGFFGSGRVETYALCGLSLSIQPGEVVSLLGRNGSGKSTTLRLISTVLLPDHGSVFVNGANTATDGQAVRKQVGFALASERSFFPRLTIRENLMFFASLEDVPWRERRARADEVLAHVGLENYAEKQAMKLSSGMYQRLGIARALIKNPRVLLLDEPSRSLDPAATEELWDLLRTLASSRITIVLATHNFAEAIAVSDRVSVLHQGRVLRTFTARTLSVETLQRDYRDLTEAAGARQWAEGVPA